MRTLFHKLILSVLVVSTSSVVYSQNQQFTTPGVSVFTVPSSVVSVKVQCVGAGGGGGRVTPSNIFDDDAAGGGGGGAYAMSIINVVEGNNYDVTVGAGGYNNGSSADGGNSYFATGSEVLAEGGRTRSGNDEEVGADGGKAINSIGTVVFDGGNGGNGDEGDSNGGGGGGAAGSGGIGHNGGEVTAGLGQAQYGGYGGEGGPDGATGGDGADFGGGGGGSSANGSNDRNGGNGARGIVVVSWSEVHSFSPSTVCASGSSSVQVLGLNFTGIDSVVINGQQIPFNFVSDTEITLNISSSTPSGVVYVYTPNGCSKSATSLNVVHQSVNVSVNSMTVTANYTGNGNETYEWLDCINGNSVISGATSSSYTAVNNSLYAVRVTENGCSITSSCAVVNTADIIENSNDEIKIYPNPTTGKVFIENNNFKSLVVKSIDGKIIKEMNNLSNNIKIDLSRELNGIYFIQFNNQEASEVIKIVKTSNYFY